MPILPRSLLGCVAATTLAAFAAAQDATPTFAARCQAFATWFTAQAKELHADLNSGDKARTQTAAKAIGARVAELVPGLRINFERGPASEPLVMYLQPGKDRVVQLLGRALLASLPPVEQFRFVPWRLPAQADTDLVVIGKDPVRLGDLVAVCQFDEAKQGLVVHVWNQHLGRLGEADRVRMVRFGVERAFGAAMEQRWLRDVHVLDDEPTPENDGYARGADLRRTALGLLRDQQDPELDPDRVEEAYFKSDREFPAGSRCADIAFGSSRLPDLVYDLQVGGTPDTVQRLARLGAAAGFVAMTATIAYDPFDDAAKTKVLTLRKQFADELGEALTKAGVGALVGTASGSARAYYDVLLFDLAAARPVLERVAKANALVQSATLVSFSPTDPKELLRLK